MPITRPAETVKAERIIFLPLFLFLPSFLASHFLFLAPQVVDAERERRVCAW